MLQLFEAFKTELFLGLITIRIHALYGLNPHLKWVLGVLWLGTESATLYLAMSELIDVAREWLCRLV